MQIVNLIFFIDNDSSHLQSSTAILVDNTNIAFEGLIAHRAICEGGTQIGMNIDPTLHGSNLKYLHIITDKEK